MNTNRTWVAAGVVLGGGLLLTTVVLWHENRELRGEQQALLTVAEQPESENAEPVQSQVAPEELARLRANESEVLRLRNEVGLLRKQLAQRAAAQEEKLPPETPEPVTLAATNGPDGAFEAKLSANIPQGQTLAFGGWTTESGNRAVAFVDPVIVAGSGSNAQVLIRTTLMEVPPEVWGQLGLADIKADPQFASPSSLVSEQQAEDLIASLTNQPNCLVLNRPFIQTSDGMKASLFVGQVTESNQQKGLSLDCLPQLGSDGRAVHLDLAMKVGLQGAPEN